MHQKSVKKAKGHHITPHMHRTLGKIAKTAPHQKGVRGYGSPGGQREDFAMHHMSHK